MRSLLYRKKYIKKITLSHRMLYLFLFSYFGKVNGCFNQCQMRIGLWEITQQSFGFKIDIFTKQSQMVAIGQQLVKHMFRFSPLTYFIQTVNEPKGTNGK